MTTKVTKRDNYNTLLDLIASARDAGMGDFDYSDLETFVTKEIESLEKKAEQARARAAKRKAEGDELQSVVYSMLTTEPQILMELLEKVKDATGDSSISAQKLAARMKGLVDSGKAQKFDVTVTSDDGGKSRTVKGYALPEE